MTNSLKTWAIIYIYYNNQTTVSCLTSSLLLRVTCKAYRMCWPAAGEGCFLPAFVFDRRLLSAPSEALLEGPQTPQGPPGGKEKVQSQT